MKKKSKRNVTNIIISLFFLLLLAIGAVLLLPSLKQKFYPREYSEYVSLYSSQYNVPEPLVYAVIQTESNFQCDAVSSAGAKGLMQLMPETFDWINFYIGEETDEITDPEINIKYGTYYLSWLYEYFGDWETAVAAYNAGHGRVENWLDDSRYSIDGKTLKEIPLNETDNYVNKVFKSYNQYNEIYYGEE